MADVEFIVDLSQVVPWFNAKMKDYPKLLNKIFTSLGNYMTRATKKRFDDQVSPNFVPWQPLSGLTRRARAGKGRRSAGGGMGMKALLKSGAGKRSIGPTRESIDRMRVGPKDLSAYHYLGYHQGGARWNRTRRQAWWMVFNLFGFNPKRPQDFTYAGDSIARRNKKLKTAIRREKRKGRPNSDRIASLKSQQTKKISVNEKSLAWLGWVRARATAEGLMRSMGYIPARPFAGISSEDDKQMEIVVLKRIDQFWGTGKIGKV